jgi:hypothetical protein
MYEELQQKALAFWASKDNKTSGELSSWAKKSKEEVHLTNNGGVMLPDSVMRLDNGNLRVFYGSLSFVLPQEVIYFYTSLGRKYYVV